MNTPSFLTGLAAASVLLACAREVPAVPAVTAPASGWTITAVPDAWRFSGYVEDKDLSGIAVTPDFKHCLICTDEGDGIQMGIMDRKALTVTAGATIDLLPEVNVPKTEVDTEGVAWMASDKCFYVTGSHGVSKKKGDFDASRCHIIRIPTAADGAPLQAGVQVGSLLPWVEKNSTLSSNVRQPLQLNGFNIEGLAAKDGKLWFGVRGPNLKGDAFVIEATPASLFTPTPEATLHALSIGNGMGVRELVGVKEGFLILTGNACAEATKKQPETMAPGEDQTFRLFIWKPGTPPRLIGDVPQPSAKAEGMLLLDETESTIDILMLFDSAPAGGPRAYRISKAK